ncbi:hypothetical protein AB0I68_34485 [Streptomyces sp. NPDC050448]|uniref:hypothetical protein n=1 Tax=Streptomyces sp. NPDC050448 TaxID=3155404 RepID=UPI00341DE9BB
MSELLSPALSGAVAGLGVAMPMGAMSVLLLQEAMRRRRTAMAAAAGIATVDLGYAALAAALGPWVASHVSPVEAWIRLASAAILLCIAAHGLHFTPSGPRHSPNLSAPPALEARGLGRSAPDPSAPPPLEARSLGQGPDPSAPPAFEPRGLERSPDPSAPPAFEPRGLERSPDPSAPPALEARGLERSPGFGKGRGGELPPAGPELTDQPESRPAADPLAGPGAEPGVGTGAEPWTGAGAGARARARAGAGAGAGAVRVYGRYVGLTAVNPTTALYFAALTTAQASALTTPATAAAFLTGVATASLLWQQTLVAVGAFAGRTISPTARAWTFRLGYGLVAAYALKIAFPLPRLT